jgi:hypothetical protein
LVADWGAEKAADWAAEKEEVKVAGSVAEKVAEKEEVKVAGSVAEKVAEKVVNLAAVLAEEMEVVEGEGWAEVEGLEEETAGSDLVVKPRAP